MILDKKQVVRPIEQFSPNPWNPNEMNAHTWRVFKSGMARDGWLSAQALLVWGSDENKVKKGLIIDGEHRWRAAKELGFKKVPVVYVWEATEAQAKALTIKLNSRKGKFDPLQLGSLVRDLATSHASEDLAEELGLTETDFTQYLSPPTELPKEPREKKEKEVIEDAAPNFGMLQLFFSAQEKEEFLELEQRVLGKFGYTKAHEALREACLQVLNA